MLQYHTAKEKYAFFLTNDSFEERVGSPDEFNDVIGRVSLNFNELERQVSEVIIKLIKTGEPIGIIITSELSFKNKLNLLGSLFHFYKSSYSFNSHFPNTDETFDELLKACFRCEELRNQIMHSQFIFEHITYRKIVRCKRTAKAKQGLKELKEEVNIPYLFDVADYIFEMSANVEEFFWIFEENLEQ